MLKQRPQIIEKENAVDFEFKEGTIELKNIGFKHFIIQNDNGSKEGKGDYNGNDN